MYKFQPWIPSHKYLIVFIFKLSAHISVYNALTFGNSSLCPGVVPVKYASKILIQIGPRCFVVEVQPRRANGGLEQRPDADGK